MVKSGGSHVASAHVSHQPELSLMVSLSSLGVGRKASSVLSRRTGDWGTLAISASTRNYHTQREKLRERKTGRVLHCHLIHACPSPVQQSADFLDGPVACGPGTLERGEGPGKCTPTETRSMPS